MAKKTEKKEKSASRLFIILLFLVFIVGGAGFVLSYLGMFDKGPDPVPELENIQTKKELIAFCRNTMPEAYTTLLNLNEEIGVINKEVERLDTMAKEFPQQVKIISSEKKNWDKMLKELTTSLSKLEKEIEAIYVSYMINPEKGMQRIQDPKTGALLAETNTIITTSQEQTARLKVVEEKTFMDTIKERIFNKAKK